MDTLTVTSPQTLTVTPTNTITFLVNNSEEVMRLDGEGMVYKGRRIEDAGEAHRVFLEVMAAMRPNQKQGLTTDGTDQHG